MQRALDELLGGRDARHRPRLSTIRNADIRLSAGRVAEGTHDELLARTASTLGLASSRERSGAGRRCELEQSAGLIVASRRARDLASGSGHARRRARRRGREVCGARGTCTRRAATGAGRSTRLAAAARRGSSYRGDRPQRAHAGGAGQRDRLLVVERTESLAVRPRAAVGVPRALTRRRQRRPLAAIAALAARRGRSPPPPATAVHGVGAGPLAGPEIVSNDTSWGEVVGGGEWGQASRRACPFDAGRRCSALQDDPRDERRRFDDELATREADRAARPASPLLGGPLRLPELRVGIRSLPRCTCRWRRAGTRPRRRRVVGALTDAQAACVFDGVAPPAGVRLRPGARGEGRAHPFVEAPDARPGEFEASADGAPSRSGPGRPPGLRGRPVRLRGRAAAPRRLSGRGPVGRPPLDLHEPGRHRVKKPPTCTSSTPSRATSCSSSRSPVLLTHPKLRHGIPFRLGVPALLRSRGRGAPRIWLHGASAGDLLLQPMMKELKGRPRLLYIVDDHHQLGPRDGAQEGSPRPT